VPSLDLKRGLEFMRLGICSIFRDEAGVLDEWIQFHVEQGFNRFYLFDDASTDDFRSVLDPYISSGLVRLLPATSTGNFHQRQVAANNEGLRLARGDCDWLAFIDVDEYLFGVNEKISAVLPRQPWVAGIVVWWKIFGSSGHEKKPKGFVVSNYLNRGPFPDSGEEFESLYRLQNETFFKGRTRPISGRLLQIKSIVRPRMVRRFKVHFPLRYRGIMSDELGRCISKRRIQPLVHGKPWMPSMRRLRPSVQRIRINHYWSRSTEELLAKARKRDRKCATEADYLRWDAVLNQQQDLLLSRRFLPNSLARD
jgi:hypothetical protein